VRIEGSCRLDGSLVGQRFVWINKKSVEHSVERRK
jgi:hypothetical protein